MRVMAFCAGSLPFNKDDITGLLACNASRKPLPCVVAGLLSGAVPSLRRDAFVLNRESGLHPFGSS